MPKTIIEIEDQEKYKLEGIDQLETSEKTTINEYLENSYESERNQTSKNENLFLYFTPISNQKKRRFIPSTPKKIKDEKEKDIFVKGKNLLCIFESMKCS